MACSLGRDQMNLTLLSLRCAIANRFMNFRHIETPFFILLHHKRHYSGDAIFAHSIGVFHFAILLQYPISLFFTI